MTPGWVCVTRTGVPLSSMDSPKTPGIRGRLSARLGVLAGLERSVNSLSQPAKMVLFSTGLPAFWEPLSPGQVGKWVLSQGGRQVLSSQLLDPEEGPG